MASGMHRKVKIQPNDLIVFSSNPIPGNEKAVSHVINELFQKGADVIFQDVHVSGHACQEEIKLIYSLVKPKYSIPAVSYTHLGIDSPVAGYMIAKRGVSIDATYFHAPPYTSERAKQKVVDLAKLVAKYSGPINLHIVNFTDIQLAIYEKRCV